jgi:gliding motility-associated-like protein
VTATSDNTSLIPNPTVNYTPSGATGSLDYIPVANQSGTATITVTVDDGQAANNTVSKTFTVTVNAVNDQPTLADIADPTAIDEDAGEQTVNLSGISAGGGETQTLTVTATSDNTGLIPNPTVTYSSADVTGSLAYTPVSDQSGTATITVTVDDGQAANNTVSKTFTVTVDPVNDQPTLADIADPTAIDEDAGEQTVNLSGISAGGGETQTLTVTATSDNTGLIPNPTVTYISDDATGSLAYTPVSDQSGTATITVTVDDGQAANNTVTKTFTVTVDPVNDAPIIDTQTLRAVEKETTTLCITASDIEGDTHQFVSGTSSNGATITNSSSADMCFQYSPADDFIGIDQVEVTICDANAPSVCTTSTINVEVLDVNDSPIFTENGVEVNSITIDALEDTPLDLCLEYTDPEGHNVSTIRLTNLSGSGILTENSTTLCYTYAPEENMNGTSVWQVDVQDDGTPPATATVFININIANVNDAPETRPDTLIVMRKESKSTNVLFNDFDLDGDDLRLRTTLEKQPVGGTATVSPDGTITYFSDANFRGTDSLIYIVEDLGSPSLTAFGKMIIRINDNPFTIYQTVSPNGDGMNDYWHIEGIDFYPNNKVSLFDRYNNLVFEVDGYNNEDKVWIGNSNKGSNNTLPEGTYFYRINAGEAGTFGGFVVLRGTQN